MSASKRRGKSPGQELLREVAGELGLSKQRTRAYRKRAVRVLKIGGLMMLSAVIVPITMISLGLLLGPKGYEGLVAAPLAVFSCWALILFFGLKRRATPQSIARARLRELPEQVGALLEDSRGNLPRRAQPSIDRILDQLEELAPALSALTNETMATRRLRRLLTEDLGELVEHFRKLPARLRNKPAAGGQSPEEQLISGLSMIESELLRMHDEMANDDLYSLATKQRYLELKYGPQQKH